MDDRRGRRPRRSSSINPHSIGGRRGLERRQAGELRHATSERNKIDVVTNQRHQFPKAFGGDRVELRRGVRARGFYELYDREDVALTEAGATHRAVDGPRPGGGRCLERPTREAHEHGKDGLLGAVTREHVVAGDLRAGSIQPSALARIDPPVLGRSGPSRDRDLVIASGAA